MTDGKRIYRAHIRWLSPEQGGRACPPSGPRYFAVVHFHGDATPPGTDWSLVVDLSEPGGVDLETTATVWLLFHDRPGAPQHLLHPGSHFELREGAQVVAKGEILGYRTE